MRTEGATHLAESERIGPGNFENGNFGNAISFDLVMERQSLWSKKLHLRRNVGGGRGPPGGPCNQGQS